MTDPEEPTQSIRPARPNMSDEFPFPKVLPEDPDEREEVLRRFAEWDGKRREAAALIEASVLYAAMSTTSAERSYDLVERMGELGAPDPQSWARSEVAEDIPQEARWLILRAIWPVIDMFSPEGTRSVPAAQRLLDAGADPEDVSRAMRHAAMSGVFGALCEIDSMTAMSVPPDAPGWRLVETRFDPKAGDHVATGRHIGGLHESLSSADPSGRGGADLFE